MNKIKEYWEVSPPFKGQGEPGSLEHSRSISEHRYKLMPHLKEFISSMKVSRRQVLEIGYGSGSDLITFAKEGAQVVGIDITEKAKEITAARLRAENLQAELLTYDGKTLPFEDESFDHVYSCGVLHHTPYMDDLLAEAHRVLRKRGELLLMVYNKMSLLYYYSILYLRKYMDKSDLSREEILSKYSEFRVGCPYTRCFSASEMKQKLWFFDFADANARFCVYDTPAQRKLIPRVPFCVKKTGIADLDLFMDNFDLDFRYYSVHHASHTATGNPIDCLQKYGWHLMVKAAK